jgi:hypothetical protein
MRHSRRSFLSSSLLLSGMSAIFPGLLTSCLSRDGRKELQISFIGTREQYDGFRPYFSKLRSCSFVFSSFQTSLSGDADIVFLHQESANKSSYILLLLEQGRDVLCRYPLGYSLGEYAGISEFQVKHGRMIGMLNPLIFYPSTRVLKEIILEQAVSIKDIRINCHPGKLETDFPVSGLSGTAQPIQRMVSYISGSYPRRLLALEKDQGGLAGIELGYDSFTCLIRFDESQIGWNMEVEGDDFICRSDHTGLLSVNNEVEPRLAPDPGVFEDSLMENLENFMHAVRIREQSLVNSLDGLASIVLNNAVEESLNRGSEVFL